MDDDLKQFINLVQQMMNPDLSQRIDIVGALNHEFFLKDQKSLEKLKFKQRSIANLEEFWNVVTFKDEIKNIGQFLASCHHPSSLIERIFEAKDAENLK